jgi:hypothetical protein
MRLKYLPAGVLAILTIACVIALYFDAPVVRKIVVDGGSVRSTLV